MYNPEDTVFLAVTAATRVDTAEDTEEDTAVMVGMAVTIRADTIGPTIRQITIAQVNLFCD